jgi:hypothetical protein
MFDATLARIIIEVASAIVCIILVKFMMKPYQLTKEVSFLGLPLAFGFLGVSYILSAIVYYSRASAFFVDLLWFQSLIRTFAFVFLVMTYYFSKKSSKFTQVLSNITFSSLIVLLVVLFLTAFVSPQVVSRYYTASQIYVRSFNVICLSYLAIHTLRSHIRKPDPATIWIPSGFILLAISQYSLLFWYMDTSYAAFIGALALRLAGLFVFLMVSYRTFYGSRGV